MLFNACITMYLCTKYDARGPKHCVDRFQSRAAENIRKNAVRKEQTGVRCFFLFCGFKITLEKKVD